MKMNQWYRWLGISLLFILPVISFFFLQNFFRQNQSAEKVAQNEAIGKILLLVALIITLFCLLWNENIDKSLRSRLQNLKNDIFKMLKKRTADDKEDSQQPSGLPSKPSSSPGAGKIDKKQIKKKKIDKFENYDQIVEKRIRNQWERVKQRNNTVDEENELRGFAMQLKTKRYEKTDDWIWVLRNFFRARPERLQGLLFEISERIADLDEIKKTKQEKPAEPEKPKRRGAKKGKATPVSLSPSLGEDTKPDEQTKEGDSFSSSGQSKGEAEETK